MSADREKAYAISGSKNSNGQSKVVRPKSFHANPTQKIPPSHTWASHPYAKNKLDTTDFDSQPPANQHSCLIIARAQSTRGRDKTIAAQPTNISSMLLLPDVYLTWAAKKTFADHKLPRVCEMHRALPIRGLFPAMIGGVRANRTCSKRLRAPTGWLQSSLRATRDLPGRVVAEQGDVLADLVALLLNDALRYPHQVPDFLDVRGQGRGVTRYYIKYQVYETVEQWISLHKFTTLSRKNHLGGSVRSERPIR